jgi:serine phosphatase RsbU (regulator of sigma subunit)
LISQELTYEFEKKEENLKLEHKTQLMLEKEVQKRQKLFIVFSLFAILFIGVFSYYIYKSYKNSQKQNVLIAEQKLLVEHKNLEITQSIEYAKHIQTAILPPKRIVKEYLPNSFILYKPKDIVAGDFYWMERKGDLVMFAAADCTGHGVPGAMVSVICNNGLNRSVKEFGIVESEKILDKAREIVVSEFEKSDEEVKDGMDISLCVLNTKTKQLKWSGANNPLWLIRSKDSNSFVAEAGAKEKVLPFGRGFRRGSFI